MSGRICPDKKPCNTWYDDNKGFMVCRHGLIFDKCPLETQYAREKRQFDELIEWMEQRKK